MSCHLRKGIQIEFIHQEGRSISTTIEDGKLCCVILFYIRMFCIFCHSFCHVRNNLLLMFSKSSLICYEFFNIFISISHLCKMLATIRDMCIIEYECLLLDEQCRKNSVRQFGKETKGGMVLVR